MLITALVACLVSAPVQVNQTAHFKPKVFKQVYQMAEKSFAENMPCPLPQDIKLAVKDATLLELNRNNSVFIPGGGVSVKIGLYDTETKTISVVRGMPGSKCILFHELLHFFIMESAGCSTYKDVSVQHSLIHKMEEDCFEAIGSTRENIRSKQYRWMLEYLKKL